MLCCAVRVSVCLSLSLILFAHRPHRAAKRRLATFTAQTVIQPPAAASPSFPSTASLPLSERSASLLPPPPRYYPMSASSQLAPSADGDYPQLRLTAREESLFSKVLSAVSAEGLQCTVRVAGGWVRDKLLGLQSDDIDFALDTVTGTEFAAAVSAYLLSTGQGRTSSVGTIKSNPEQSKHLETATFVLDGVSIDANRFRDEVYHEHSRIPEVRQSSALEDAQRRDFTINALFYNIHTRCVEDLIGGMTDIRARRIRTPTSAAVTFRDDPLRVLRAARFAARFGYDVDREARQAAASEAVQRDLRAKVTRERVGIELRKMLVNGRTATRAMALLSEWGLRQTVLDVGEERRERVTAVKEGMPLWPIEARDEAENSKVTAECRRCMVAAHRELFDSDWAETAHKVVHSDETNKLGLRDDEVASALLMAYLVPYFGWHVPVKKKLQSLHWFLLRDALKLPAKESELCDQIFSGAASLTQLAHTRTELQQLPASDPALPSKQLSLLVQTGKLLRALGLSHRLALLLAPILESSLFPERPPAVADFVSHLRCSTALFSHSVWSMRPLLDGDEVQLLLGLRPGRHISALQERLIEWQIERLQAVQSNQLAKQDVAAFLHSARDELRRDGLITDKHVSSSSSSSKG